MNETDLRELLQAEAGNFRPAPGWLTDLGNERRHVVRPAFVASLAAILVLVASVAILSHMRHGSVASKSASGAVYIRLAGYQADTGATLPRSLQQHMSCMRAKGFDLPDPIRSGRGWFLKIRDPNALGIGTPRWKRAAFGTCALVRDRAVYNRWIHKAVMHPRPRRTG
jgi:hypothetical protein